MVSVDREHLLVHIGDKQILPAAVVEVSRVDAHSRPRLSVLAEGYAGIEAAFVPLPRATRPRPSIHIQEVLHGVIGDEQVHAAVIVDISGNDTEPFTERIAHYRILSRFCK